jgi:outer membrane protein
MTKSFRFVLVGALLFAFSAAVASAQSRIATVDLVRVFDQYWKTKQSKLALNDSKAELKKELDTMNEAHQKLATQYRQLVAEANDQAVSSEERERRKKALEPRVKELQDSEATMKSFVGRGEAELEQKTKRMMETVIEDIRKVVAGRAKAAGYAYVLDSSAKSLSQTEVVLYSSGDADLTDAVVKELNLSAPLGVR